MKKAFILLLTLVSLSAIGQSKDSLMHITVQYRYHCAIQTAMGEWGKPERISYAAQVAMNLDTTLSKGADSAYWKQNITVKIPRYLFVEVYQFMGNKPEAVYGIINSGIETQAIPQVGTDQYIAPKVRDVNVGREVQRQQVYQQGDSFFLNTKRTQ